VIVTGYSVTSAGYTNYATIKYSSAGVPLWTNRYVGPANWDAYACAVAVDSNNNIIVTGYSYDTGSSSDYATIKYSSEGVPLWTNRYNGPGNGSDYATAVAVDGSNNVIVTGWSPSSGGLYHYATVKYSSEGVPLWTNRYSALVNSLDRAFAVAVDSSNNVVVTGKSMGKVNDYDYATVKYSSEGVPLWTNRYSGSLPYGTDSACSVAVDSNNNIIVTGWSGNFATLVDAVYATVKYSSAGVPVWTNRYSAPVSGTNQPYAMALDRTGNVIVAGYSQGTGSGSDFTTIKYLCVPSPVLTGRQLTNGTFQLLVEDVLKSGTLVIEASTNLGNWAPVFSNTTPTNALFYTDPDANNWPVRFYRAFQFP